MRFSEAKLWKDYNKTGYKTGFGSAVSWLKLAKHVKVCVTATADVMEHWDALTDQQNCQVSIQILSANRPLSLKCAASSQEKI